MSSNLGSSIFHVYFKCFPVIVIAVAVEQQQVAHNDMTRHFNHSACMEIDEFVIVEFSYFLHGSFVLFGLTNQYTAIAFQFRFQSLSFVFFDAGKVAAGGYATDGSNHL